MAAYIWIGLLVAAAASNIQAHSLSSEEEECLEPIENSYYIDGQPCLRLGATIIRWRDFLREAMESYDGEDFENFRHMVMRQIGIDMDQDRELTDLACQLDGVDTVDELIELVNLTRYKEHAQSEYQGIRIMIARMDGFHGLRMALEVKLAVINRLREMVGPAEGYLNYTAAREVVTAGKLAVILHVLEHRFGPGYLIYFLMMPYNDALVGVDHQLLAQAIIDNDIACRLGVSQEIQRRLHGHVQALFHSALSRELVDITLEAYVAADQMGLFNLRN